MDEEGETCALLEPKKRPACRSKSVQQGSAGSRFFNQYRLLMDSTKGGPRRLSVLDKSLSPIVNHRNSIGGLKPSASDHEASSLCRFRSSSKEQVTRQPLSPLSSSTEHSLKVIGGPLSSSASSPLGFNCFTSNVITSEGYGKLDYNQSNKSYPLITVLERDGVVSNRKFSYDSSSYYRQHNPRQPRRHDRLGTIGKPMDINVPVRWSARSRTTSVVGALPNIPYHNSMKTHKSSAPSPTVSTVHPVVQLKVSGDEMNEQQQNPLWNVSNEYMRVSGYTSPFNKLLSIKRKKGDVVSGQQVDLEKANEDNKNDPNGTTAQGLDANKIGVKTQPRSVYGRLYTAPMNQKQLFKKRKDLFGKRIFVCNLTLFFAFVGIAIAIVEAELSAADVIRKTTFVSCFLRGIIVLSTLILLCLLIWYHAIEIKISMIDSGAHDWRVALTADRVVQMLFELFLCSLCPIPGDFWINSVVLYDDHRQYRMVPVPLDNLLSLPMFLRFYLVGRFMALHSGQFQDAATRSIARLNRVTVNFGFVMKTLMVEHPLRVLFTFTVTFWLVISWILVQCERYDGIPEHNHYMNAIWFTIITFMSIGYGDIVPNTYCGRVIAITTGIVGAGVSSALIAVMSIKMELSRAEKHVNNFMTDTKLSRQRKDAAAMVLQHTWFIHKYKGLQKAQDEIKLRFHQRKFLASINEFRKIKWDQRKLAEQGDALVDVAKLQSDMHTTLWEMQQTQNQLATQIQTLTQRIQEMYETIVLQSVSKNIPVSNVLSPSSSLFVASPNVQNHLLVSPQSKLNFNDNN